ncbi:aminopeptidase P N-terminal domain-containing protein [Streptomyces sp. BRA346]|uniref:aminopeptidase P N-terminal domain-containing protein n=1 Tax=Streptomyces sp. BRA346 TaxID=2878199 RepID=UPI0040646895
MAGGSAPVRSNDTRYDFRPDSNFSWLTGCTAEDAVLVLRPSGTGHDATLYLPPPASRASSPTPRTASCGSAPPRAPAAGRTRSSWRSAHPGSWRPH